MTIDWNHWREAQHAYSFADQQRFYEAVLEAHPNQASFEERTVQAAFDKIAGRALDVVELGGWDGRLAALMLPRGDIASWINYDLVAPEQACSDPRYRLEVLDDYLWNRERVEADVFVASHTIEHLTGTELVALLDTLAVEYMYLEAPLPLRGSPDWSNYQGSHILELNWEQVEALLTERGYEWRTTNLWRRGR